MSATKTIADSDVCAPRWLKVSMGIMLAAQVAFAVYVSLFLAYLPYVDEMRATRWTAQDEARAAEGLEQEMLRLLDELAELNPTLNVPRGFTFKPRPGGER